MVIALEPWLAKCLEADYNGYMDMDFIASISKTNPWASNDSSEYWCHDPFPGVSSLSQILRTGGTSSIYAPSLDGIASPLQLQDALAYESDDNTSSRSFSPQAATTNPIPDPPLYVNPRFISPQKLEENADGGVGIHSSDDVEPRRVRGSSSSRGRGRGHVRGGGGHVTTPSTKTNAMAGPSTPGCGRGRGGHINTSSPRTNAVAGPSTSTATWPAHHPPTLPHSPPSSTAQIHSTTDTTTSHWQLPADIDMRSSRSLGKRKLRVDSDDDDGDAAPTLPPPTRRKTESTLTKPVEIGADFRHAADPTDLTRVCRYSNLKGEQCNAAVVRTAVAVTAHLRDAKAHGWRQWPKKCTWRMPDKRVCGWEKKKKNPASGNSTGKKNGKKKGGKKGGKKDETAPGPDRFSRDCFAHFEVQKQCVRCDAYCALRSDGNEHRCEKKLIAK